MIETKKDIIIENSAGTLTITMTDGRLIFEITKNTLGFTHNLKIPVSHTDAKKLIDELIVPWDTAKNYSLLYNQHKKFTENCEGYKKLCSLNKG